MYINIKQPSVNPNRVARGCALYLLKYSNCQIGFYSWMKTRSTLSSNCLFLWLLDISTRMHRYLRLRTSPWSLFLFCLGCRVLDRFLNVSSQVFVCVFDVSDVSYAILYENLCLGLNTQGRFRLNNNELKLK